MGKNEMYALLAIFRSHEIDPWASLKEMNISILKYVIAYTVHSHL